MDVGKKNQLKIEEKKKAHEEKIKNECTFHPKISKMYFLSH